MSETPRTLDEWAIPDLTEQERDDFLQAIEDLR